MSEWPRSKFQATAVRQRRNFGHRNRVIGPYGWYAGCENRARSCSVPGEVSLFYFYRSHSGRARFWMPETMPMAANKVTMEVPP